MTDGEIQRIGRNLQAFKSMQYRVLQGRPMTQTEREEYEAHIAFARAIERAASPNKELVEALQGFMKLGHSYSYNDIVAAKENARAALRAAGEIV